MDILLSDSKTKGYFVRKSVAEFSGSISIYITYTFPFTWRYHIHYMYIFLRNVIFPSHHQMIMVKAKDFFCTIPGKESKKYLDTKSKNLYAQTSSYMIIPRKSYFYGDDFGPDSFLLELDIIHHHDLTSVLCH